MSPVDLSWLTELPNPAATTVYVAVPAAVATAVPAHVSQEEALRAALNSTLREVLPAALEQAGRWTAWDVLLRFFGVAFVLCALGGMWATVMDAHDSNQRFQEQQFEELHRRLDEDYNLWTEYADAQPREPFKRQATVPSSSPEENLGKPHSGIASQPPPPASFASPVAATQTAQSAQREQSAEDAEEEGEHDPLLAKTQ